MKSRAVLSLLALSFATSAFADYSRHEALAPIGMAPEWVCSTAFISTDLAYICPTLGMDYTDAPASRNALIGPMSLNNLEPRFSVEAFAATQESGSDLRYISTAAQAIGNNMSAMRAALEGPMSTTDAAEAFTQANQILDSLFVNRPELHDANWISVMIRYFTVRGPQDSLEYATIAIMSGLLNSSLPKEDQAAMQRGLQDSSAAQFFSNFVEYAAGPSIYLVETVSAEGDPEGRYLRPVEFLTLIQSDRAAIHPVSAVRALQDMFADGAVIWRQLGTLLESAADQRDFITEGAAPAALPASVEAPAPVSPEAPATP